MSTDSTGAAEPGTAAAEPSEPPAATPLAPPAPLTDPSAPPAPVADPFAPPADPFATPFQQPDVIGAGAEPARSGRKLGAGALFLTAVLAGPALGLVIGYGIQASRPETPLPQITAAKLTYPERRIAPQAMEAPKPLNIDGDLRELLVAKPDGAKDLDRFGTAGWMNAAGIAEGYGDSEEVFQNLLAKGFRRAAVVAWEADDAEYRVQLIQYRPENLAMVTGEMNTDTSGADVSKIPGNPDSVVLVKTDPLHYAKSTEQYYLGEALARKGTMLMKIEIHAKNPVDRAKLEDLAKRQWERIA